ncbi:MAG: hypothetical protein AAB635_01130 [Patescibacteria group bacterium]
MNNNNKNCSHVHHNIIPILVILIAVSFLLQYQGLLAENSVNIIWPILVGIGGMVMLIDSKCERC